MTNLRVWHGSCIMWTTHSSILCCLYIWCLFFVKEMCAGDLWFTYVTCLRQMSRTHSSITSEFWAAYMFGIAHMFELALWVYVSSSRLLWRSYVWNSSMRNSRFFFYVTRMFVSYCVWHDLCIYVLFCVVRVTWLIHMCFAVYDSVTYVFCVLRVAWLIRMCHFCVFCMSWLIYVCFSVYEYTDVFSCVLHVAWLIYLCDMAHAYMCDTNVRFLCIACGMTHSYVLFCIWFIHSCFPVCYVWHELFTCVTWLMHMCDKDVRLLCSTCGMTHSHVESLSCCYRRFNVTHMHESCHTYGWVMSHIRMSHVTHWMSHFTYTWMSHFTYEWVMSHIWMSHVIHMNESCH